MPEINWWPQEEASAPELVKETLQRARTGNVLEALIHGTKALGFDTFVFGIVANDRRPNGESRSYVLTNQADAWVSIYEKRAFLEFDPRIELAGEPGYAYWEARQYDGIPRYRAFLAEAAIYGIRSGLVIGLCTRDPPSYAMMALNCASGTLDHLSPEDRLLIAGQAQLLGKVLSRSVRKRLSEEELLFPAPSMNLNAREKHILTLAASGKTSKEIADEIGVAKITVDMHVGAILSKMGALNRYQAIAKAIAHNLINVVDDGHAEYKSAKLDAVRRAPRLKSVK